MNNQPSLPPSALSVSNRLQWRETARGTNARLRALSAVSDGIAWAAGADGVVLRSINGGRTWKSVGPAAGRQLQYRSVKAFDANHAVVMSFGAGNAARIFLTSDAGKHWTESFRNPDPLAFYNCLTFGDRCRGLAVADPVQGRFRIMATADGGHSWRAIDPAGSPPALDGETAFAASGTCLIGFGATYWLATGSAERARVFRSCDRGETWTVANTPVRSVPHGGIFALAFRNETHGIAVGGDYRDQSRPGQLLAVTMDGGLTWRAIEERAPQSYRSGATWTGAEFVVVGPGGSDYSTDGGSTWVPFGEGGLDTVSVALDGACWAAGDHGRIVKLARTSR